MAVSIRKGTEADIPRITEIYDRILTREEAGLVTIGWQRGVYPTEQTAREALWAGELFVLEDAGQVLVRGVRDRNDIQGNPALDEARALGRSIG